MTHITPQIRAAYLKSIAAEDKYYASIDSDLSNGSRGLRSAKTRAANALGRVIRETHPGITVQERINLLTALQGEN